MEQLQIDESNSQFDLRLILWFLLRYIWVVVFAAVLGGICGLIFTKVMTEPMYTSATKLYILESSDSDSSVTSSQLSMGSALASDYAELITDREVAESVISELGLSYSAEKLISEISVEISSDSGRFITISVTDTDPYLACKIAMTVRDVAAEHISDVMNSAAVNVVEEATIPTGQAVYQYQRNSLIGAGAGAVIPIAILLLIYFLNDTVNTADDAERYLKLTVLGTIPIQQEADDDGAWGY
ncbi:MAG: Wzz/FepE/Etk N-terminal domain-containing protein [Lachnospiraceae bacterium]|nr:Wzz/FepE/Etk N-terminal domain-containing protein [Lachnospiraceae bacterium]